MTPKREQRAVGDVWVAAGRRHPSTAGLSLDVLTGDARQVLDANWRGTFTIPSTSLYPDEIAASSLELAARAGFYEYFDPFDGAGHGSNDFGWTAALAIDLVEAANR